MPMKKQGAEPIGTKLRQIQVLQSQGESIGTACKEAWITKQSCCRCRK